MRGSPGIREAAPSRPARAAPVAVGFSRGRVIGTALEEIDHAGLAAFSLRGLARRLGMNASVVAWHVGSRDVVLVEVAAAVLRDAVPAREGGQAWQDWLRGLFRAFRAALHRHPNAASLIGAGIVSNLRPDLPLVETLLTALEVVGVAHDRLLETYNAVQAALVGFVPQGLASMPTKDLPGRQAGIQASLAAVDRAEYPRLARHMPRLLNRAFVLRWQNGAEAPMNGSFDVYVDCIIAGVSAVAGRPVPWSRAASCLLALWHGCLGVPIGTGRATLIEARRIGPAAPFRRAWHQCAA
jgi:AcrR family transcriptional regulator